MRAASIAAGVRAHQQVDVQPTPTDECGNPLVRRPTPRHAPLHSPKLDAVGPLAPKRDASFSEIMRYARQAPGAPRDKTPSLSDEPAVKFGRWIAARWRAVVARLRRPANPA